MEFIMASLSLIAWVVIVTGFLRLFIRKLTPWYDAAYVEVAVYLAFVWLTIDAAIRHHWFAVGCMIPLLVVNFIWLRKAIFQYRLDRDGKAMVE